MRDSELSATAGKKCQVGTAIEALEKAIAHANELGAAIEDRFSRVLMPDSPSPTCGKPEGRPTTVELAEQLERLEDGVVNVSACLQSVLDRCEL